ncbi:biotin carboxylase [Stutzerimonas stutzeri]|uniref:Biotin carboxylase n=1 Tax=Stutzerimonas stutzeri TaxID=316 RepID=W8R1W9_STUST|nr:DUF3182 family protein [Stutzerimonas stutzeri]AHL76579.1 biotin carboxylase [Stutzerimonas stutzeri]MCQ4329815.1 DUF3182 family protein [Stutzerimonas stutzeri]
MKSADTPQDARGAVVTLTNRANEPEHEKVVHEQLAKRLAALQGLAFLGEYDRETSYACPLYFVPSSTVVGSSLARELGLEGERDLFGGVVPHAFIETKAITHPLVRPDADSPIGWSREFSRRVTGSVLPGYSVFSLHDAREAGRRLLNEGALRIKPVRATGGRGQERVTTVQALDHVLGGLDEAELAQYGLVLEANLEHVTTFSVGQISAAGRILSYYGTQRLTPDNAGVTVYGGSDLLVVDGDFDTLLDLDLPETTRLAISQAQVYDAAASACFRNFYASRRNYDIAQGIDSRGRACSGVLEQSWRIGGASSAEVAALEVFAQGKGGKVVHASSVELYGESTVPESATVLFRGDDAEVGFITKYALVEDYGNPE